MRLDTRFPKQVLVTLAISAAVAVYPVLSLGSPAIVWAVTLGALLSTVNVLLGYLAIEYSIDRSYSIFLKAVLGGMGVRMLLMLAVLLLLIKVYEVHAVALVASLMSFYVVFLILEVMFIQKRIVQKNQN